MGELAPDRVTTELKRRFDGGQLAESMGENEERQESDRLPKVMIGEARGVVTVDRIGEALKVLLKVDGAIDDDDDNDDADDNEEDDDEAVVVLGNEEKKSSKEEMIKVTGVSGVRNS